MAYSNLRITLNGIKVEYGEGSRKYFFAGDKIAIDEKSERGPTRYVFIVEESGYYISNKQLGSRQMGYFVHESLLKLQIFSDLGD